MQQTDHSDTPKPSEASPSFIFLTIHHCGEDARDPAALVLEFTGADCVGDCPSGSLFLYDALSPFPSVVPACHVEWRPVAWRLTAAQLIKTAWSPTGLWQEVRYWASDDGPRCPSLIAADRVPDSVESGHFRAFLLRNRPCLRPLLSLEPSGLCLAESVMDPKEAGQVIKEAARWQWLTLCTGESESAKQEEAEALILGPYRFAGDIGQAPAMSAGEVMQELGMRQAS